MLKEGDKVWNSLQVIHTPGHISLYDKEHRILIGGDVLFNSILNINGLFVPTPAVTKDWETSIVSARRFLNLKIEKVLLAHQSDPILENAPQMIEKAVSVAIAHKDVAAS